MNPGARTRRLIKGLIVGLVTGLAGVLLGLSGAGSTFERSVGLSWLFHLRGEIASPDNSVVVAINSRTGGQLGLPSLPRDWPRSIHANLIEELARRGASAIVFDIQFDKPKVPKDDLTLATAVARANNVVLVEVLTGKRQPVTDPTGVHVGSVWVEQLIEPLPILVNSARGLGTFPLPKIDAAVYEFWSFKESASDAPTLPAVALQVHSFKAYSAFLSLLEQVDTPGLDVLPRSPDEISSPQDLRDLMRILRQTFADNPSAGAKLLSLARQKGEQNVFPELQALVDLYAGSPQRYLNFYGPPGTILTIPYESVIRGNDPNLPPEALDFSGKTVFVGFSDIYDPGQPDRFYTVFTGDDGVDLSGVEIAATGFSNLLTGRSLNLLTMPATAAILLTFGFFIGMIAYYFPAIGGVPLTLALAILYAVAAQWLFNNGDHWIPLATPLLAQFPLALFLGLLGQYLLERHRGQQISDAISYYLPENVARELTENRRDPSAFNKVVYSTCLATDMSGFSSIAEQLPPGELASFLNDYFDTLAQPLKKHQVDVTEFRADAIMCAWTAAEPDVEVRKKAVLAALDASDAITRFKSGHELLKAALRVGLEAGPVYIGHAGGGGHFVFSIVGDCANTASRIEGLNKHIGTRILATDAVVEGLDGLLLRPLGQFQFVNKSEALPIVEILALRDDASEKQLLICERFGEVLADFQEAHWDKAAAGCERILTEYPDDGPSRFYLSRCRQYQNGSPLPEDPRVIRMDAK